MSTKLVRIISEIYPQGGVVARWEEAEKKQAQSSRTPALFHSEGQFRSVCGDLHIDLNSPLPERRDAREGGTVVVKSYEAAVLPTQLASFRTPETKDFPNVPTGRFFSA